MQTTDYTAGQDPWLQSRTDGLELVVPVRGDLAGKGYPAASIFLSAEETTARKIERCIRALGWSKKRAVFVAIELTRQVRTGLLKSP